MGARKLLLPYNFTDRDRKALEFTADTFAPHGGVEITLFHAYLPLPSVQTHDRQVTERLQSGMGYLQTTIGELEADFQSVRDELIDRGFAPAMVRTLFRRRKNTVTDAILDLHQREHFNLIVLSRRPGRMGRFFDSSLHAKLLSVLSDVTICVVS